MSDVTPNETRYFCLVGHLAKGLVLGLVLGDGTRRNYAVEREHQHLLLLPVSSNSSQRGRVFAEKGVQVQLIIGWNV